jgi:hypothetical protein
MTRYTPRLLLAAAVLLIPLFKVDAAPVRLNASGAADGSRLGSSVSIEHDTLVVGAPDDDAAGPFAGSVYVYVRDCRRRTVRWSEW